jgi:hypothetical protein
MKTNVLGWFSQNAGFQAQTGPINVSKGFECLSPPFTPLLSTVHPLPLSASAFLYLATPPSPLLSLRLQTANIYTPPFWGVYKTQHRHAHYQKLRIVYLFISVYYFTIF